MTNSELVQIATAHFEDRGRHKEALDCPRVRESVAVYFKVKPRGNCLVVLDKNTGEIIHSICTLRDALLPEYGPHLWLPNEARTLVEESRKGIWDKFPEGASEPAVSRADLIKALALRCPGFSSAEYERALTEVFQETEHVT